MLFSLFYGSVFKNLANPSHMYYKSAMLNSRSKEDFFFFNVVEFSSRGSEIFVLLFIFIFLLNLVVYFYPRHLPAPATSTRESRPATLRHTPYLRHLHSFGVVAVIIRPSSFFLLLVSCDRPKFWAFSKNEKVTT